MRRKDIKNGQTLVYCRGGKGPMGGRYRDSETYEVKVIDVDWKRKSLWSKEEREKYKHIIGAAHDGVLVEYDYKPFYREQVERRQHVVLPRQLSDVSIAEVDAYWEGVKQQRDADRQQREAAHAMLIQRRESLTTRMQDLGIEINVWPPTNDQIEALIKIAEAAS